MAEDAWNGCDPIRVAKAYTTDSHWRNRSEFIISRAEIDQGALGIPRRPHRSPLRLRMARRQRALVSLLRQRKLGLTRRRVASINDLSIAEAGRMFRWPRGPRPERHPGLSDLGL
jgi:uncharacterized protein